MPLTLQVCPSLVQFFKAPSTSSSEQSHAEPEFRATISAVDYEEEFSKNPEIICDSKAENEKNHLDVICVVKEDQIVAAFCNHLREKQVYPISAAGNSSASSSLEVTNGTGNEQRVEAILACVEQEYQTFKTLSNVKCSEAAVLQQSLNTTSKHLQDVCKLLLSFTLFENYQTPGTLSETELGDVAVRLQGDQFAVNDGGLLHHDKEHHFTVFQQKESTSQLEFEAGKPGLSPSPFQLLVNQILRTDASVQLVINAKINQLPHSLVLGDSLEKQLEMIKTTEVLPSLISLPRQKGTLILLRSSSLLDIKGELSRTLLQNSIYSSPLAKYYDIAYSRFQFNNTLKDLVLQHTEAQMEASDRLQATILDLCGGTGIFSKQLNEAGFKQVYMADGSAFMLKVARDRLAATFPHMDDEKRYAVTKMEQVDKAVPHNFFNTIVIRQAMNYVDPKDLVHTFSGIRRCLKPGGFLIFNSFEYSKTHSPIARVNKQASHPFVLITREKTMLTMKDKIQEEEAPSSPALVVDEQARHLHAQKTHLFNVDTGAFQIIYDLNSFFIHTASSYKAALEQAGFTNIHFLQQRTSIYFVAKN